MAPQNEERERKAKAREIQRQEAQREHQEAAAAQLEQHRLSTLKVFEAKEARLQKWQENEARRHAVCHRARTPDAVQARLTRQTNRPDLQDGLECRDASKHGLRCRGSLRLLLTRSGLGLRRS